MARTGCNGLDTLLQADDRHWRQTQRRGAVAELAEAVVTPTKNRTCRRQCARMCPACRDGGHGPRQPSHSHRRRLGGDFQQTVAQLAGRIQAPAIDSPSRHCARMIPPCGHRCHASRQPVHPNWLDCRLAAPVAQLAIGIVAPTLHRATGCQQTPMLAADAQLHGSSLVSRLPDACKAGRKYGAAKLGAGKTSMNASKAASQRNRVRIGEPESSQFSRVLAAGRRRQGCAGGRDRRCPDRGPR